MHLDAPRIVHLPLLPEQLTQTDLPPHRQRSLILRRVPRQIPRMPIRRPRGVCFRQVSTRLRGRRAILDQLRIQRPRVLGRRVLFAEDPQPVDLLVTLARTVDVRRGRRRREDDVAVRDLDVAARQQRDLEVLQAASVEDDGGVAFLVEGVAGVQVADEEGAFDAGLFPGGALG